MNPWRTGRNHGCWKQGYDDTEMLQSSHSSLVAMKKEIGRIFAIVTDASNKSTNSLK